jgi:hypothetical protein
VEGSLSKIVALMRQIILLPVMGDGKNNDHTASDGGLISPFQTPSCCRDEAFKLCMQQSTHMLYLFLDETLYQTVFNNLNAEFILECEHPS